MAQAAENVVPSDSDSQQSRKSTHAASTNTVVVSAQAEEQKSSKCEDSISNSSVVITRHRAMHSKASDLKVMKSFAYVAKEDKNENAYEAIS